MTLTKKMNSSPVDLSTSAPTLPMYSTTNRLRAGGALALCLFIGLLWLYPLASLKLGHQNDIAVHLRWVEQFYTALQDGIWLPRWAYAAQLGLGDPSFFYYQPLFYYLTSAFLWLGAGPERALVLAAAVPFLMVAGIVYWHFLSRYPTRAAVLGAMFVVGCPTLYFMSTHLAAFPWSLSIPFSVLFAAESVRDKPRAHHIAVLLCLICLSHLLSGMMALLCVGLARLVFMPPRPRTLGAHAVWLGGALLGLSLAAFFIYPALTQMHLINPAGWEQNFDWRRCFSLPFISQFLFGTYWFGIQWPFAAVCLGITLLVLVPRTPLPQSTGQRNAKRLAIVALCAFVLGSELAYPLYALLSPMQKLQFPYRFMFLASILASIALMIHLNEGAWLRWSKWTRGAALLLIAMQCGQAALLQLKIMRGGERMATHETYFSGRFGQPEYLLSVRGPHWTEYANTGALAGDCARLGIACSNIVRGSHAFAVRVETPRALRLRLPVFAFPAWQATVDGRLQASHIDEETGVIAIDVAPGVHQVGLRFGRLPAETLGIWISVAALGMLLLLAARARHASAVRGKAGPPAD
jgi:hypothetical protein